MLYRLLEYQFEHTHSPRGKSLVNQVHPGGGISIIKSIRYHDSRLGKATQANTAYLSRSSLNRLSTLLGPQCPNQYHRSSVFRCLTSRRIFLLPVRTQLSFDGRHRLSQAVIFGCPYSQATESLLDPFYKGPLGLTRRPTRTLRDKVE